ncbi:MAG: PepSY domain-containing protein [Marinosulfonomonas sp.]|nr:PepSY domain-containing protein [Marinosulfonomonas sp.]
MKTLPLKPLTLIVALGLSLAGAKMATASNYETISDEVRAQITARLTTDGYDVRKIEREDGMIEVYALKGGQRFEIYLDADLNVSRIKQDN